MRWGTISLVSCANDIVQKQRNRFQYHLSQFYICQEPSVCTSASHFSLLLVIAGGKYRPKQREAMRGSCVREGRSAIPIHRPRLASHSGRYIKRLLFWAAFTTAGSDGGLSVASPRSLLTNRMTVMSVRQLITGRLNGEGA